MKQHFLFIIFILSAFALNAQSLTGKPWNLVAINDRLNNIKQDIDPGFKIYIAMDTDSTYHGRACNSFRGTYKINGRDNIVISRPTGTKKHCQGAPGNIETNLYRLLSRAGRFVLSEGRLLLYTDDQHELVFVR